MPKIDEVLQREARRLPKLQKAVLDYLEAHPDEVFSWNKKDLSTLLASLKLKGTRGSIGWSIWSLHRHGYIERLKVGRRHYYGSHEAIRRLAAGVEREAQPTPKTGGESADPSPEGDTSTPKALAAPAAKAEPVEAPIARKTSRRSRASRKTA